MHFYDLFYTLHEIHLLSTNFLKCPLFCLFWHCPLKPFFLPFLFLILPPLFTYFKMDLIRTTPDRIFWGLQKGHLGLNLKLDQKQKDYLFCQFLHLQRNLNIRQPCFYPTNFLKCACRLYPTNFFKSTSILTTS